ncbi:MAG: protein translocase subunit SecE [Pirellulaceae bacterium]|nr:MAG: protein translocase subunit SecE [Pirellulaceae bacterium]
MSAIFRELFQVGIYKRTQGQVVRQVTGAVVALGFLIAAWQLYVWLRVNVDSPWLIYGPPMLLALSGLWCSYRLVNVPRFADFLIAVEAEMRTVWWPSWNETWRSSAVVIFVMFFLAAVLFAFDFVWTVVFQFLGILKK